MLETSASMLKCHVRNIRLYITVPKISKTVFTIIATTQPKLYGTIQKLIPIASEKFDSTKSNFGYHFNSRKAVDGGQLFTLKQTEKSQFNLIVETCHLRIKSALEQLYLYENDRNLESDLQGVEVERFITVGLVSNFK